MKKRSRTARGYTSMAVGIGLLVGAAFASGEPSLEAPTKVAVATASAVSGSVLTFVVARRLLTTTTPDGRGRDARAKTGG